MKEKRKHREDHQGEPPDGNSDGMHVCVYVCMCVCISYDLPTLPHSYLTCLFTSEATEEKLKVSQLIIIHPFLMHASD